jgi:predicted dehydrogenase
VRRGRHVFLEKPVGVALEEALALFRSAEEQGVVTMTTLTARADWAAETALAYRERLGEVVAFRGAFLADYLADPGAPIPWGARVSGGGPPGVVGDLGAHLFDLVHWFLDEPLDRPQTLSLEIEGERGGLRVVPALAGKAEEGRAYWADRPGVWEPIPLDPSLLRGRDPKMAWGLFHFLELVRRFLRAVERGERASPSLREGVLAQAVIQAVLESAQEGAEKEVAHV